MSYNSTQGFFNRMSGQQITVVLTHLKSVSFQETASQQVGLTSLTQAQQSAVTAHFANYNLVLQLQTEPGSDAVHAVGSNLVNKKDGSQLPSMQVCFSKDASSTLAGATTSIPVIKIDNTRSAFEQVQLSTKLTAPNVAPTNVILVYAKTK